MSFVNFKNIKYGFDLEKDLISDDEFIKIDVFFAEITTVISAYSRLMYFIDYQEKERAKRFRIQEDRDTYLLCHALLRLVLSNKLDTDPAEISIVRDKNNKPGLKDDPLFFNLSHTREAFAFAISEHCQVGVDLEEVRKINFESIIRKFFSQEEQEFIFESPGESLEKFFYIWTRKEALLKSAGTGIVANLSCVEVLDQVNTISSQYLENIPDKEVMPEYCIHSERIMNYILSVAAPQKKISVKINLIDRQVINSFLSNQ